MEQIFSLPPFGTQKPSEILAEMLWIYLRGQGSPLFFMYLFLHCLPRELRVLLINVNHMERRVLTDTSCVHYSKKQHDKVAAVDGEFSDQDALPVAALHQWFNNGKPVQWQRQQYWTKRKQAKSWGEGALTWASSNRFSPILCTGTNRWASLTQNLTSLIVKTLIQN